MVKEYTKLWVSYWEYFEPLTDQEVGRLVRGMLCYKRTGALPPLTGNERFVWPAIQRDIDEGTRAQEERSQKMRENALSKARRRKAADNTPKQKQAIAGNSSQGQGHGQGQGQGHGQCQCHGQGESQGQAAAAPAAENAGLLADSEKKSYERPGWNDDRWQQMARMYKDRGWEPDGAVREWMDDHPDEI